MGCQWVSNRKGDRLGMVNEESSNLGVVNGLDYSNSKTIMRREGDRHKVYNKGTEPKKQHDLGESSTDSLGPKGSGENRPSSGGIFSGPTLAEIERNVKEAQALHTEQNEVETEGPGKAMVTWKRKEREWLDEAVHKNEGGGNGKNVVLPKKG